MTVMMMMMIVIVKAIVIRFVIVQLKCTGVHESFSAVGGKHPGTPTYDFGRVHISAVNGTDTYGLFSSFFGLCMRLF